MIPDRSYASIYQAVIDFCKENGAFDPTTMGSPSQDPVTLLPSELPLL